MAVDYGSGNTTRYHSASDHANFDVASQAVFSFIACLSFPNGLTGSGYQYYYSTGDFQELNDVNMYVGEDSVSPASDQNAFSGNASDSAGIPKQVADIDNGKYWIQCFRRNASYDLQQAVAQSGDTSAQTASGIDTKQDALNSAIHEFGRRSDGTTSRYFENVIHWWIKVDRYVSDESVVALANGADPRELFGPDLKIYFTFRDEDTIVDELGLGITFTKNGTGYGTVDSIAPTLPLGPMKAGEAGGAVSLQATDTATTGESVTLKLTRALQASDSATTGESATLSGGVAAFAAETTEGDNINTGSSSIVGGDTATPTITLVPYTTTSENGTNNSFWFFQSTVNGLSGKTPEYHIADTNFYDIGGWRSIKPWFSQDGKALSDRTKTWTEFANVTDNAGTLEFSHSAAFTGDKVEVAYARPIMWSLLKSWLDDVWSSSTYVQEGAAAQAFGGETYQIGTIASDTDDNGRAVPEQKQYYFQMTDTAYSVADDGLPKRLAMLWSGMHAGEDLGTEAWIAGVNFLAAADSGGDADQQAAARLLQNFKWWCTAWTNPGRRMHHDRAYCVNSPNNYDPNRNMDGNPGLTYIDNVQDALESDFGTTIEVCFDFHEQTNGAFPGDEYYVQNAGNPGQHRPISQQWQTYLTTYIAGAVSDESNWDGSCQEWAATTYGARVSSTCEQHAKVAGGRTAADAAEHARAALRSLDDLWQAGYFRSLQATDAAASGESAGLKLVRKLQVTDESRTVDRARLVPGILPRLSPGAALSPAKLVGVSPPLSDQ